MKYIVSIDQSTSASKAFLIDGQGDIVRRASRPHRQFYPAPDRVEQDAEEIFQNVAAVIGEVTDGIPARDLSALAITNQRETTVLWDRETGLPVCPAVVWQDTRGAALCQQLSAHGEAVERVTGSALSPYLPASKIGVLLNERPDLRRRAEAGDIAMGTMESWLVYRLTGRHATDVSNASRTQLMDLTTLRWSGELARWFGIPASMLAPEILPSDACFGEYRGIPITGVLGDSFATLFGQGCHAPGATKVSYGTGTSVMVNIGSAPRLLGPGLTTAAAWGYDGATVYEIEGNITCSGDTLVWLCKSLELFRDPAEIEALARTVEDSGGVQLVPAMAGLGAPFFDPEARAVLRGMSRGTTRAHVARAALESMAQRVADVLEVIRAGGLDVQTMQVDGGGAKNTLLMQLQADLADCALNCSAASELSGLGAAYMAGLKTGVYPDFDGIPARHRPAQVYRPAMSPEARSEMRRAWASAIACAQMKG